MTQHVLENMFWRVIVASFGVGSLLSAEILKKMFNILRDSTQPGRSAGSYWTPDFGRTEVANEGRDDEENFRLIPGVDGEDGRLIYNLPNVKKGLHGLIPDTDGEQDGSSTPLRVVHKAHVTVPRQIFVQKTTELDGRKLIQRFFIRNEDSRPYACAVADHPFFSDTPGNRFRLQASVPKYARPPGGLADPTPTEAPIAVTTGEDVDFSAEPKVVPPKLDESGYEWDGEAMYSWDSGAKVKMTAFVSLHGLGAIPVNVLHRYSGQQAKGTTAVEPVAGGGARWNWMGREGKVAKEDGGNVLLTGQTVEMTVVYEILD